MQLLPQHFQLQGLRAEALAAHLALAAKDQLDDKLLGFESGADDYIVKPLALPELEIRLRVLAARSHKRSDVRQVLEVADLCFDLGT
ncbi:response regulator transcription factor [Pseudomonas syringae pv. actinidiae]|nr:response regulator transcription factor [Pseudomonas syringae pv. actinidiae]